MSIPNKLATGRPIQMYVNRQTGMENPTSIVLANEGLGINATDTTIQLSSTANLASVGFIKIGAETISYSNISGNQLVNCYRGQNGTTIASHSLGTPVYQTFLPNINVWPTGNPGTQYVLVYYRMRRMQDAGTGVNGQDIPFRLIPAVVAGLAHKLSAKLSGVDPQRYVALKAEYDQAWQDAQDEDREKAAWRLVPRNMFYYR